MAVKHRRLFPTYEVTQSTTCPDGDGCYAPYEDYGPPLPPPPPPPPPLPQPKSGKHVLNIPQYIIITVALAASFIILLSYYLIVVRNCFGWIRRRPAQRSPDGENQEFLDENRGPVIDHPIWYIRTIGLQPSVINTITIFKYKMGDGLIEGTDCSVCLNEFQEGETLRLLPKCNHAFHIRCVDTWLRSHTNCPLCRAAIVSNAATPARNSNPGSGNELIQADNTAERNGERNGEGNDIEAGNRGNRETVDEEEVEIQESDGDETRKMEGLGDGNNNVVSWTGKRRSLSIDSSIAANVVDLVEREARCLGARVGSEASPSNTERSSRIQRMIGSGSIAECLHERPVLMKRSFSYGGRSFFSRHQPRTQQN